MHDRRLRRSIDWDALLVRFNTLFAAELAVLRAENDDDRQHAEEARDALLAELEQLLHPTGAGDLWRRRTGGVSASQVRIQASLIRLLMPAFPKLAKVVEQRETELALLKVTIALGLYRAEHGSYPAELTALVPEYLPELPTDAYPGPLPLGYRLEGDEFILYSNGPNRKDDGGDLNGEPTFDPFSSADDQAVRSQVEPAPTAAIWIEVFVRSGEPKLRGFSG